MNITRREFVQQTGWGLLTLAISQGTVNRHLAALAAPNPRKLALLVGIDQYGANIPPLPGCLTDVELQKDLLRYRFGFQDADQDHQTIRCLDPTRATTWQEVD